MVRYMKSYRNFYEPEPAYLNAPLVAVPVQLQRTEIDPSTEFYKYELAHMKTP